MIVETKSNAIPASNATPSSDSADQTALKSLVEELASSDATKRQLARRKLVRAGAPAVPPLIRALADPRRQVRWEAAKALGRIADPISANALVRALKDRDTDVRWLAAVALVAMGREALLPLLSALLEDPHSEELRLGAHHVCHGLAKRRGDPDAARVLAALNESEPEIHLPVAAYEALCNIRQKLFPGTSRGNSCKAVKSRVKNGGIRS